LSGRRIATQTERLPERWRELVGRDGHGMIETAVIAPHDAAREHLLMNLRLNEGIDLHDYRQRWNVLLSEARMQALIEQGLLTRTGERLRTTPRGRLLLNRVIAELVD
jgi:oxygen-independent coproporphyrinogen-3 oxidase